jgi:Ser/Thr protein kinase RdoA (MazF antagonist)
MAVLRAARNGFGLGRGTVSLLSTRFGKVCLAHRVPGGARAQVRLLRESDGLADRLDAELRWLLHLSVTHHLRVPRPIRWRNGSLVSPPLASSEGDAWRAVACTWVRGVHLYDGLRSRDFRRTGRLIAAMHNATADVPADLPARRPTWNIDRLFELATTLRDLMNGASSTHPDLTPKEITRLRHAHQSLAAAWAELPVDAAHVGLIHTDTHGRNMRWHRGAPGLVDFEDVANGRFMLDLACFHSEIQDRPGAPARLHALLDGYAQVRPLPTHWQRDLQVMLAFRQFDLAGWVLSWPRLDQRAWGPRLLRTTAAYIDAALSEPPLSGRW